MATTVHDLRRRLDTIRLVDAHRIGRRLEGVRKIKNADSRAKALGDIAAVVDRAEADVSGREASRPLIRYPEDLPVSVRRDDLAAAIRDHQVVIVAGETGSGKTTQLPKICLELGRGVRGLIGHTQPRRIAARTVAERIAEEVGRDLGDTIGYTVRFTDQVSTSTLVKVMTDGILLAEIQRDRMLRGYDTLIIDEAHERSLNVDFILGYLKQLLPRRPDLKVIITSATIDPSRFAAHFDDAPIVEVSGRTYPVEVRYWPIIDPDDAQADKDRDQTTAICEAVDELETEPPGDILVFCSGEREIRDAADALNRRNLRNTEVLALFARLSAAEQHRVFQPHTGRRIVLATNVAETSLTVPGIKYVIDPGTARISRYSQRLKVQRLPIEAISQASANQRAGRCGRTSNGICIRLFSEDDYESRPEFTEPEILRTNLASVILQMIALDLGDLPRFPFLDPPDQRTVRDGLDLLHELGAVLPAEKGKPARLTDIGRQLAQMPVDPRMGRMLIEAARNGALRESLIIVSGLSIQDPRERPADHQQAADSLHARFADPDSDFTAYLNLWGYLRARRHELSSSAFRRTCRAEFLHYLRIREWQDVHTQLRQTCKELDLDINSTDASPTAIHQSLLAGLLSHVGLKDPDTRDYVGARGAAFAVFPGSGLFKKPPRWVMAAELVETTRLWARQAARIEPDWIEPIAEHLVKRTYSQPHWEKKRASVLAAEKVTLYGIPIVVGRPVSYGRIDPVVSRELFIRSALVEGDWDTRHEFFHANRALLDEVIDLEERVRRRDLLVDDETLFAFYDDRVGAEVVSGGHFDSWWKNTRQSTPGLLDFESSLLMRDDAGVVDAEEYPTEWHSGDVTLPLGYVFEPGTAGDGVTVDIPLASLQRMSTDEFLWGVPGRRAELVAALIKTLPKSWRRQFVPAPDHAAAILPTLEPGASGLVGAVADALRRRTGVVVPPDAFDVTALPAHLRMNFRVLDGNRVVGTGKDLDQLREELKVRLRSALAQVADGVERTGLRSWDFPPLEKVIRRQRHGQEVSVFPALVDEGTTVGVRVFESEGEQARSMRRGTRALLLLTSDSPVNAIVRGLSNQTKLALADNPYPSVPALLVDCVAAAVDDLLGTHGGPAWDADAFALLRHQVRADVHDVAFSVVTGVGVALERANGVRTTLDRLGDGRLRYAREDMEAQLRWLVHDGFVSQTGRSQLVQLPRYLTAIAKRIERLPGDVVRDDRDMLVVQGLEDAYDKAATDGRDVDDVRWMLEELRVSLFAQTLGTAYPVSPTRIRKALIRAL